MSPNVPRSSPRQEEMLMEQLIKRDRRTVLLVSHNIRQVERLCSRVLMLDHGKVAADGKSYDVCRGFIQKSQERILEVLDASATPQNTTGTGEAELESIVLLDSHGTTVKAVPYRGDCSIRIRFTVKEPVRRVALGVGVHTPDFLNLTTHNSEHELTTGELAVGTHEFICRIRDLRLVPGTYALRVGLAEVGNWRVIYYAENVASFQVVPGKRFISDSARDGFFELDASWSMSSVADADTQLARSEESAMPAIGEA